MIIRSTLITLLLCLLILAAPISAQPAVAEPFREYYQRHQGMRILGPPISGLVAVQGYPAQYFEKGRIEDHRAEIADPVWGIMYGRLTAELMQAEAQLPVSQTTLDYAALAEAADPAMRVAPPEGFSGGTAEVFAGTWPARFIPVDPQLRPAPGYVVPGYFWEYMNRCDLFPAGWLHDIGLPLTPLLTVQATKNGEVREVQLQAFERAVLTYDVRNPIDWLVERANIGSDALQAVGE